MKIINHFIILFFNIRITYSYKPPFYIIPFKNNIKEKYINHLNLGYDKARKILFEEFEDNLIYGEKDSKQKINCEHVWCQKYFKYKEPMKSDLHIMYLANSKLNSHRQDYKFSNIHNNYIFINNNGNIITNNFFNKLISNNLYKKNNTKKIFEPCDKSKGKISRSLAYFNLIYENDCVNEIENVININELVEWNRNHLPNVDEIKRNEMIRNYQNNINPFIKYPVLLELFYNNNFSVYHVLKLSCYSIFSFTISELFKFNYYTKKILVKNSND